MLTEFPVVNLFVDSRLAQVCCLRKVIKSVIGNPAPRPIKQFDMAAKERVDVKAF